MSKSFLARIFCFGEVARIITVGAISQREVQISICRSKETLTSMTSTVRTPIENILLTSDGFAFSAYNRDVPLKKLYSDCIVEDWECGVNTCQGRLWWSTIDCEFCYNWVILAWEDAIIRTKFWRITIHITSTKTSRISQLITVIRQKEEAIFWIVWMKCNSH